jgi:hypothetical protein
VSLLPKWFQGVFILLEPCHFDRVNGLKNHFFLMTIIWDKDPLHIINKGQIVIRDKDLLHIINEEQIFFTSY